MKELNIRRGVEDDRQALQALLAANQMTTDIDPGEFLLAIADGKLAGAARLEWQGQTAYLRPVVVDQKWQRKGVGRALIENIMVGLSDLVVVARGEAVGFYRQSGFLPIGWEKVSHRYRQECIECPDLRDCKPLPMRWKII